MKAEEYIIPINETAEDYDEMFIGVIRRQPVLIRCKDCKFSKAYYHGSESNLGMFTYLCTQGLYGMNADDYCSRAERKDDDQSRGNGADCAGL